MEKWNCLFTEIQTQRMDAWPESSQKKKRLRGDLITVYNFLGKGRGGAGFAFSLWVPGTEPAGMVWSWVMRGFCWILENGSWPRRCLALEQAPHGSGSQNQPDRVQEALKMLSSPWCDSWGCPVLGQDQISMILLGPLQPSILCDSGILIWNIKNIFVYDLTTVKYYVKEDWQINDLAVKWPFQNYVSFQCHSIMKSAETIRPG